MGPAAAAATEGIVTKPSPRSVDATVARLDHILEQKGLRLQGIYTGRDVAKIFGVGKRTIQEWIFDGKLPARDLPGRGRFLSEDLEEFLRKSIKRRDGIENRTPASPNAQPQRRPADVPRKHRSEK